MVRASPPLGSTAFCFPWMMNRRRSPETENLRKFLEISKGKPLHPEGIVLQCGLGEIRLRPSMTPAMHLHTASRLPTDRRLKRRNPDERFDRGR